MRYLELLKPKATIGLCAPSFGCATEPYMSRLTSSIKKFRDMGYNVVLTEHCYSMNKIESCDAKTRANEFMQLWLNPEIDFIATVGGGEVMMEMLPFLDFDAIKKAPGKYIIGYSDITCLSFLLPTICDIPTLYGPCFPAFGCDPWDDSIKQCYDFLTQKINVQHSFDKYEIYQIHKEEGHYLDPVNATEPSEWKTMPSYRKLVLEGRLIGGCLDVLILLQGTPFDKVPEFLERYRDDGIIWFFESCDLNIPEQIRAYWKLKQAGWFKYCKGIVIGRPLISEPMYDVTYQEALERSLKDLGVPIIYDVDIGHVGPSLIIKNGSRSIISYRDGKGTIEVIE